MWDPIGLGLSAVGGIINDEFEKERRSDARLDSETEYLRQKEFAQHGIRWRVEDAKAAGIHPVFSLSGGGAAYAPSPVTVGGAPAPDLARDGQDLSRAARSQETVEQKESRRLSEQVALSQIKRNEAEAAMFDSVTVKNYNQTPPPFPSGAVDANVLGSSGQVSASPSGSAAGIVEVTPSQSTSYAPDAPWLAAGKSVMFKKYKLSGNREWLLPDANSASEALEAVSESWPLTWMVLKENIAENPYFFAENRHLLPDWLVSAGEFIGEGYGALEKAFKAWRENRGHPVSGWPTRQGIPGVDGRLLRR